MAGGGGADLHVQDSGGAIELNLGLAVGGSATMRKEEAAVLNLAPVRSPRTFPVMGSEPIPTDPEQKKRYHAQRRKEARQKQDEKLLRRGIFRAKSMVIQASTPPHPKSPTATAEYMAVLEAQLQQSRFVDRKGKESEAAAAVLHHHCDKQILPPEPQPNQIPTTALNLPPVTVARPNPVPLNVRPITVAPPAISPRPLALKNISPNPAVYGVQPALPVMQMHLSYKPVAMVPCGDNYAIPWMVPYWAPVSTASPPHKAIYSPLAIQPLSAVLQPPPLQQYLTHEGTFQGEALDDQEASKSKGKGKGKGLVFPSSAVAATAVNKTPYAAGAQEMVTASPRMVYVGVKRNDGTTMTGYLHKYSKPKPEKVRIVCTCHERKMTPAEFVKHAGRAEVEDPLNHILMLSYPC